ncbi:caspase family protein [Sorangium sp. So ce1389]|uniref:caspase family protein n=1 Tax=Sorangium sp. So ce1389 TaxID=3133336 RepID=UPI003F609975
MTDDAHPAPSDIPDDVKPVLAATRELLSRIGGVALLVGVESYRDHDEEGGKDLLAGRNDVLAYWKVCRRLGYTHLRVLSTPALQKEDLIRAERELAPELHPGEDEAETRRRVEEWLSRGRQEADAPIELHDAAMSSRLEAAGAPSVLLGEATSLQLEASARWLARRLVFTVKLEWEQWRREEELMALPGFMAYSGHGAQRDGELLLCPSDTGPALENALSFSELRAIFDGGEDLPGGKRPADNLTVVLDCCFAAASGPAGKAQRATSLTPAGSPAGKAPARSPEIARSVFCASGRDEQSYQAMLGGHWHGAFTWAFTVALEQWKIQQQGQFRQSTMSHAELLFRARTLLSALSFPQHPILVDELGNLPVFHHGAAAGEATSAEPDARRPGGQLDPSVKNGNGFVYYEVRERGTNAPLAQIVVTNDKVNQGFTRYTEYWKLNSTGLRFDSDDWRNGITVTRQEMSWSDRAPFQPGSEDFRCNVKDQEWKLTTHVDPYQLITRDGVTYGFRVNLSRQTTGDRWTGTLWWSRSSDAKDVFALSGNMQWTDMKGRVTSSCQVPMM